MDNNIFSSYSNLIDDLIINVNESKDINKNKTTDYSPVFNEFLLNNLKLKNHFYFYNLSDNFLFDEFGNPTEKFFSFYDSIAKSDVGLIFTGGVYAGLKENIDIKNLPVINNNTKSMNMFIKTISAIHTYGAKFFLTIKSIYGRADNKHKFLKIFPYSASYIKSYHEPKLPCVRLSDGVCYQIVDDYKKIAQRAIIAGFDGVLIDGNLFGLVGEFSSGEFNKRKFGYFSELIDLPLKIVTNITKDNKNINIIYRFTLDSILNLIYGKNKNKINTIKSIPKKARTINVLNFLTSLVNAGVDGFIFEFGTLETEFFSVFNQFQRENLYEKIIYDIRKYFNENSIKNKFDMPVTLMVKDNYNRIGTCANIVRNDAINLFDVTKNVYSDNRFLLNEKMKKQSNLCLKCSYCDDLAKKCGVVECCINPNLFNEKLISISKLNNQKIAVVGAGVSGIVCALTLASRGYQVDLYDKNNTINKNSRRCEIFNFDNLLSNYNNYLEESVNDYIKHGKIKLFLNTNFDIKNVDVNLYYSIIVATGFHERFLNITGAILKNVKSIYDVLDSEKIFDKKNSIVINAKSELSFKLSLYLLLQKKKISIIIQNPNFLKKMENDRLTYYLYMFKKLKANIYFLSKIKYIQEDFVELFINNKTKNDDFQSLVLNYVSGLKISFEPKAKTVDCDLFIYEPDVYSNNRLYYELVKKQYKGQLYLIGNALEIGDLASIVQSGYFVGKNL